MNINSKMDVMKYIIIIILLSLLYELLRSTSTSCTNLHAIAIDPKSINKIIKWVVLGNTLKGDDKNNKRN